MKLPLKLTCIQLLFVLHCLAQTDSVSNTSLDNKLMFGYQGWFACKGDGTARDAWNHWFPNGQNNKPAFDFWPDVCELDDDELFDPSSSSLNYFYKYPNGNPAKLYSAYKRKTVARHFKWMKQHKLDGVFFQRFTTDFGDGVFKAFLDTVLQNVKYGAEQYGRVFALMYDISSGDPNTNQLERIKQDWIALVDAGLTNSSRYLKHNGKPILAIWGLGFKHQAYGYTTQQALEFIDFIQNNPDPKYRATYFGGVPTNWRTVDTDNQNSSDALVGSAWKQVYTSMDIISPWTVGRYSDVNSATSYAAGRMSADINYINSYNNQYGKSINYLPVIWPGFSWFNLQTTNNNPGAAIFNQIPRNKGSFFWQQAYNAITYGATMLYVAMFDEVDEGTAMFKLAENSNNMPDESFLNGRKFVPLNIDGYTLPSDYYLYLANEASQMVKGEKTLTSTLPPMPAEYNQAKFISHNAPHVLKTGETFSYTVTFKNTGTKAWLNYSHLNGHYVGSESPQDNVVWGTNRGFMPLQYDYINHCDTVTFTFNITAPSIVGKYPFQWSLLQDGVEWFSDKTPNHTINVIACDSFHVTTSYSNATCGNCNDGTAKAIAVNGAEPYEYTWLPGSLSTDSIFNLTPGIYTICISEQAGCASVCDSVSISYPTNVHNNINDRVQLYPNPNNGHFYLQGTSTEPVLVDIYNSLGALVRQTTTLLEKNNRVKITLDPLLCDGLYVVQISTSQWRSSLKMISNNSQ